MKRIESHFRALQKLMGSLTAGMIAEPIKAISLSENVAEAQRIMQERHFDVLGVKDDNGKVVGYLSEEKVFEGKVEDAYQKFCINDIIYSAIPLKDCTQRVCDRQRLFVLGPDGIESIVTMADLRKPPVCLMIFGIISLLEMTLLVWIREKYQEEEWKDWLNEGRIEKSRVVYDKRRKENQENDLADCLQLCDKVTVLVKTDDTFAKLDFLSKSEAETFFTRLRNLRDNLAHAQDPARGMEWSQIFQLTRKAEFIVEVILKLIEEQSAEDAC